MWVFQTGYAWWHMLPMDKGFVNVYEIIRPHRVTGVFSSVL
jgi:hypothetical protein